MAKTRKPGRPAGVRNESTTTVAVFPPTCPKCQSTERRSIRVVIERQIRGSQDGHPHTHILWRRVRCKACGQLFTEREYQNRVHAEPDPETIENLDSFS